MIHQVTLEIQAFIDIANIEAQSGAHAMAKATSIVDHKALIDRYVRGYSDELPEGTVLSVRTGDTASSGVVMVVTEDQDRVVCSYEVSQEGQISPGNITPRIAVVESSRKAINQLNDILHQLTSPAIKEQILDVIETLSLSGIADTPDSIEDQIGSYDQPLDSEPDQESHDIDEVNSEESIEQDSQGIYEKIVAVIKLTNPEAKTGDSFTLSAPIYPSPYKEEAGDGNPENLRTVWKIDFGEIEVFYEGKKVALVGQWKEYADQSLAYMDDVFDFNVAQSAILQDNDMVPTHDEKPNLPEKLESVFLID